MLLTISHQTRYKYDQPVPYGLQQVRLRPACSAVQTVVDWQLDIEGGSVQARFPDEHGNSVDLVRVDPDSHDLVIACRGTVETRDTAGVFGMHSGAAPLWYFRRQTDRTRPGPAMRRMLKALDADTAGTLDGMHALSALVAETIQYDVAGTTDVATSGEEAAAAGHGVCQDHAHVMIGAARQFGLPARYISGYLLLDGQIDQEASHAWAEIYLDTLGWVGFDVSNRISPDERYVRVASGLDYAEAAPVSGVMFGGGAESLLVTLQVQQ